MRLRLDFVYSQGKGGQLLWDHAVGVNHHHFALIALACPSIHPRSPSSPQTIIPPRLDPLPFSLRWRLMRRPHNQIQICRQTCPEALEASGVGCVRLRANLFD